MLSQKPLGGVHLNLRGHNKPPFAAQEAKQASLLGGRRGRGIGHTADWQPHAGLLAAGADPTPLAFTFLCMLVLSFWEWLRVSFWLQVGWPLALGSDAPVCKLDMDHNWSWRLPWP